MYVPSRSTSGATCADLLVASAVQKVTSPYASAEVGLGLDSTGHSSWT